MVDSYSAAEFASLSALPANPSHDGLVAQGWNWSLADAQAYVAEYGMIDIGQLYLTESGDTEIDIKIPGNNFEIKSYVALNGTISIDWGDGSEPDELTQTSYNAANQAHTYAQAGLYTISIKAVSGSWRMYGNTSTPLNGWLISNPGTLSGTTTRSYMGLIEEVRCGNGLLRIHLGCSGAKAVAMSSGMIVESYGFYENRRLKALI